jgi:co-chaperonin GroES (HSP10)
MEIQSNYFLVEPDEPQLELVSKGGIILPKKTKRENLGTIVKAGDSPDDPRLIVGCRVMFNVFGGTKIDYNGKEHFIFKADNLFGIVEDKPLSKSLSEMKL